MNQIFRAAAETVSLGWLLGFLLIFFMAWFIGWTVWAYLPRNKAKLEEAARMPLTDGGDS